MGIHYAYTRGLVSTAFCIFFIAISEHPVESSSDEVSYEVCKPRNCGGNRPNISYPFYIPGERRDLCGYPGFEITCEETETMYARYSVKSISYNESSIHLVSQRDTSCFAPRPFTWAPMNIFLNNSVTLHPKLLFFYNCTDPPSFPFPTSPVSCTPNTTYNSSVALLPNGTSYPQSGSCRSFSVVPVQPKGGFSHQTIKDVDYKELLENGFRLKWDILTNERCTGCQDSGGRCGRSRDRDFLCYCPHGTNDPMDCNSGGGAWSLREKGALGASIGAFGVAIIVLAYLCQQKISKWEKLDEYVMDAPCFTPRPSTFYPINPILGHSYSFHPKLWFFYNRTAPFSFRYPRIPVNCASNPICNSFVALIHPSDSYCQEGGA